MDLVLLAVKNDLDTVLRTGWYLLSSLFILAVFIQYLGVLENRANWPNLLLRLVIGFVLLQNYVWIMDTTKEIVVGVDQRINPEQSYINQYASMSDNMRSSFESNTQVSFVSKVVDFFGRLSLHNLIINLSFIFYALVSKVMEVIRYSLLGILYKLGPVLVPLILFNSTSGVLKGWFTSYVTILSWPILWHIALSVAVALSAQIGSSAQGIEQFAALNFAVCLILILTPLIMSSLVSGGGLGGTASIAGAFLTTHMFNRLNQVNRAGMWAAGQAATRTFVLARNNWNTPTTMPGKFKTAMTGKVQGSFQSIKKALGNKGENNE
jgi:hypothetical protein